MSDLITRTARLVPYAKRPKQVPSFVTAYSYEPLADEAGARLGSLYVVMEVLVSGRASEEVADLIIETIGDQYYNQGGSDSQPLAQFEAAIKAANRELSEYVNRGNAAWIGKLSAVIAVQVGAEVHITQTGSAEAFLYRGKASTRISSQETSRPTTPNKTFGSIATGQLEAGDRLLIATPALIHQVALKRLQSIISSSSPNSAIADITQLLRETTTERIAALIIEITTPEIAALQIRSEQPDEIQLGTPENALEAAKIAAAPIAQTTVDSSKKIASVAQTGWKRAKPHAQALSLAAADKARQTLSTKGGRRRALIGLAVIVLVFVGYIWYHSQSSRSAAVFNKYQGVYQDFVRAQQLADSGNKTDARDAFASVQQNLTDLKSAERTINARLKHGALPEQEPKTYAGLSALVSDRLDQIDGLVKSNASTVVTLQAKNARPEHFEIVGGKAYLLDAGNNNALTVFDLTTSSTRLSKADFSKLGNVVSTTISSASDGIFILTDKPSVWFYRFDTDTVAEQVISYGSWPKATAIASYATNLYLLGSKTVYKHTKTATGYSPKTDYLALTGEETQGATGLTVDGSVYLLTSSGLHRYIASSLKQSSPAPSGLSSGKNIRSVAGGAFVVATSSDSKRVGLWKASDTSLTFSRQISLSNITDLKDATYDAKTGALYGLTDNRLVRTEIQP